MPTSDSHRSESARMSIPFRIVTRQPCFYNPRLTLNNIPRQTLQGAYTILYIEDGAYRDRADLSVSRVCVVDRLTPDGFRNGRIHGPETLGVILAEHSPST